MFWGYMFMCLLVCVAIVRSFESILRATTPGRNGHPKLKSWRRTLRGDYVLTLEDGRSYRGEGTVWHRYPSGDRASTSMEATLCGFWTRARWANEDRGGGA